MFVFFIIIFYHTESCESGQSDGMSPGWGAKGLYTFCIFGGDGGTFSLLVRGRFDFLTPTPLFLDCLHGGESGMTMTAGRLEEAGLALAVWAESGMLGPALAIRAESGMLGPALAIRTESGMLGLALAIWAESGMIKTFVYIHMQMSA